ncbi:MAG: GT4 family glycosyltransferase PelF [Planctomycetes bacterium]|nr:GT4 family glycosyltransferase PelF [Planctomycetota bacterium]
MKADVCFLLEGTYPYVAGGVSTWVDQTIQANPHLRFAVVNLVASENALGEMKYRIPENVIDLKISELHSMNLKCRGKPYRDHKTWKAIRRFYASLPEVDSDLFHAVLKAVGEDVGWNIHTRSLLFSRETWGILVDLYGDKDISFIDYFWTWRFTHLPLLSVLCTDIPKASLYHCASTGYAGLLGCIAKVRHGGRLLITEHGLYAKERKIEINNSNWVYDEREESYRLNQNMGFFRQWWIDMFLILSRLAYQSADRVTTLYQGNYDMQVEHGCPAEKLEIIPNGIDIEGYSEVFEAREAYRIQNEDRPFTIGFVGRVTPIKDVKTFIRAIKIVHENNPHIKVYMMGPTEEDEEYVDECRILIEMFDLEEVIEMTGRVKVKDYYPLLDVVVLTSVSEGLPFVVLEAHAAGIPCICTDVGACRDLLQGLTREDKALGLSGEITRISSAGETAAAILRMIKDEAYYLALSRVALQRVSAFYHIDNVNARYTSIYHDLMRL